MIEFKDFQILSRTFRQYNDTLELYHAIAWRAPRSKNAEAFLNKLLEFHKNPKMESL